MVGSRFVRSRTRSPLVSRTSAVVVLLKDPNFSSAAVNRGRCLIRMLMARVPLESTVNDVVISRKRAGEPIQLPYRSDDIRLLLLQHTDEIVQAGQQFADLRLPSGEHDVERLDDIGKLAEPAPVDDGRQRRQRLFRRGVRRGVVESDGCTRLESPFGLLPDWRIDGQMQRTEQAGLAYGSNAIGGHNHIRLDGNVHIGMPVFHSDLANAANDDIADKHR